ncbi:MAG TPA: cryptochrome/photolyase family protein [Pirellulaceae bacterium]|nr:cryptochrome/photolyase family protein [Pirellulaceae bacterium]
MSVDVLLIFPHQLFEPHPSLVAGPDEIVLVEDRLFFGDDQYPTHFHKQKLWLHRASMRRYAEHLRSGGWSVQYLEYSASPTQLSSALETLGKDLRLHVVDPTDFILEKRLRCLVRQNGWEMQWYENPNFINTPDDNRTFFEGRDRWLMADFYRWQRRRLRVLMEKNKPVGGRWSFDVDNRRRIAKVDLANIRELPAATPDSIDREARDYVLRRFPHNPGGLDTLIYPTSHRAAAAWLSSFLHERFDKFGQYEDAIEPGQGSLWHSVLTPMLNIGLVSPHQVLGAVFDHADRHPVPLSSLEGFVRQVIGWREFIRASYDLGGVPIRRSNHWQHQRPLPSAFYSGTTGVEPIDDVIRRLLQTGYCHHIERLMVLGGFMFLCEINPDAIYQWFMEMFVDSYDWVMVPNVYGMSQHADGGRITTKPYFCGSAYIRRMSHYPDGSWCPVWDGLYWRWIWKNQAKLKSNPRWGMMCQAAQRMQKEVREQHLARAQSFLDMLC